MTTFVKPSPSYDNRIETEKNLFKAVFGQLSDDAWRETLVRSISERIIEGVEFPTFPDDSLQTKIHGHIGAHSINEAFDFYRFVKRTCYPESNDVSDLFFLDFAAGWGRISRPFLRDFHLKRMFAYEPNLAFCATGRACNPFINYISGNYLPPQPLSSDTFSIVVGWSIFSHFSEIPAHQLFQNLRIA